MRTEHQQRVAEFTEQVLGKTIPEYPALPDEEERFARARLTLEEALETIEALGYDVVVDDVRVSLHAVRVSMRNARLETNGQENLVDIVDGCGDMSVIAVGTLLSCGVADGPVLEEIDRSNLTKRGGHFDKYGKWIKPVTYEEANLERVLYWQQKAATAGWTSGVSGWARYLEQ